MAMTVPFFLRSSRTAVRNDLEHLTTTSRANSSVLRHSGERLRGRPNRTSEAPDRQFINLVV